MARNFPLATSTKAALATLVLAMAQTSMAWSISGTVKNSSGTALAGVSVTVKDSATYSTTTNASGAFTLESPPVSVFREATPGAFSARVVGSDLVIRTPEDGALELAVLDGAGRTLWSSSARATQGEARVAIPTGLSRGAGFLRVKHAAGVFDQAVTLGPDGMKVADHVVALRALAAYPVLVFKLANYRDTTYAMTGATQTGVAIVMAPVVTTTCDFPTTFKWKDNAGGPIATPGNGWTSIKDFTNVVYNGQHIVYMSMYKGGYGSASMAPFTNWSDAATATQTKMGTSTVAPELIYFTPKNQWILSYQWGANKFSYGTASSPNGTYSFGKALLTEDITGATYGPIDQVVICDKTNCYLFYAADNGKIYRASMPIGNFPGNFSGSKNIMSDTQANLFEAVEVYTIKGQNKYLMIVEAMGSGGRYFRGFTATSLDGAWTAIPGASTEATPFAGKKNVSFTTNWTNDISHGDLVRSHDETRTIDPCNLQMLYQGYNPSFSGAYDEKPYRLGLLTFTK